MLTDKPGATKRVNDINNILLQTVKTVYRLRKVGSHVCNGKAIYAYTVSMAKEYPQTIEEQVRCFYNTCKMLLRDNEKLTTDKKCITIVSGEFEVSYSIEFWRKSADRIAYIENGQVKTELLHRMSCEQAAYVFKKHHIDPFEWINTLDALKKYDNPADKYAALATAPLLSAAQATKEDNG